MGGRQLPPAHTPNNFFLPFQRSVEGGRRITLGAGIHKAFDFVNAVTHLFEMLDTPVGGRYTFFMIQQVCLYALSYLYGSGLPVANGGA